jgi:sterol desaturase/sphingolipid hydroxylase (fatty acid hydroxylase superfamily)
MAPSRRAVRSSESKLATHLSRLHLVSAWPVWLQVAFFLVVHDLYIYGFHRWQHSSPVLWRLHEAHHSMRQIDWLAGARSHAFEILVNQTVEFAPMVLLGAPPEVPLIKGDGERRLGDVHPLEPGRADGAPAVDRQRP